MRAIAAKIGDKFDALPWWHKGSLALALVSILTAISVPVVAQEFSVNLGEGGSISGRVVQMILMITVLSLAPSILIMMTCFTRLIIVFSLLRSAMGTQQTPPNIVIVSLSLFITGYIMAPTFEQVWDVGLEPLVNEEIDEMEAFNRGMMPMKRFMLAHTRPVDLGLFLNMGNEELSGDPETVSLTALIPAFMISEIRRAFEIGFLLYLPFIVIDMVVASILMSMGMMMLPPIMIALPFKIIFFVLVDGWNLVIGAMVRSFGGPPPPGVG